MREQKGDQSVVERTAGPVSAPVSVKLRNDSHHGSHDLTLNSLGSTAIWDMLLHQFPEIRLLRKVIKEEANRLSLLPEDVLECPFEVTGGTLTSSVWTTNVKDANDLKWFRPRTGAHSIQLFDQAVDNYEPEIERVFKPNNLHSHIVNACATASKNGLAIGVERELCVVEELIANFAFRDRSDRPLFA
jgi:hypothetical protein